MKKTTLILGACGQIGTELTLTLREKYGNDAVVATDIKEPALAELKNGPFEILDASDAAGLSAVCEKYNVGTVYHLVAMLSATGEKFPMKAWDLNMQSLLYVLELAKEKVIDKIFWPSSIAVFGPTTPKKHTQQQTIMEPSTVYGISKLAGERWCEYYFNKYGVDVRSIRYPGLISWKSQPGGGTTDYAVEIYYKALYARIYNFNGSSDF
jgi:nucleoside-diphosphate-sugar epimerase